MCPKWLAKDPDNPRFRREATYFRLESIFAAKQLLLEQGRYLIADHGLPGTNQNRSSSRPAPLLAYPDLRPPSYAVRIPARSTFETAEERTQPPPATQSAQRS